MELQVTAPNNSEHSERFTEKGSLLQLLNASSKKFKSSLENVKQTPRKHN